MAAERLSALDAAFLELENDRQHLHVGSLLVFEGPVPSFADFSAHVESRLGSIPRYRQRVRRLPLDLARPVWVDDPHFRLARHLLHAGVPSPGGGDELRALFAQAMSQRLDRDRPLWELWLVEGLADERWAVFTKTHHAMVDGLAGGQVMELLMDQDPGDPRAPQDPPARPARPARPAPRASPAEWRPRPPSRLELLVPAGAAVARLPVVATRAAVGAVGGIRSPGALARAGAVRARGLATLGRSVVAPTSSLNGPVGPHRRWGWARAELRDVKRVGAVAGGSVNDVVLAGVTGGFREYLLARGEDVDGTRIRSLVPVSVRTAQHRGRLGNQVSAMVAELPVGVADPLERLAAVSRRMNHLKGSGEAVGVESLVHAADLVPASLMTLGAHVYAFTGQRVVNTVTTNIPGPQYPLHLLGRRMLELFPYIPVAEAVRISIGIVSYDGHLTVGATGDHESVPDLDVLCAAIEGSLVELVRTVATTEGRAHGSHRGGDRTDG